MILADKLTYVTYLLLFETYLLDRYLFPFVFLRQYKL